jgi:phosphoribosyl 1,2-cyclic phosphate phosphodiesterase
MTNNITITILGCGASGGVPLIGCQCGTCQSTDPRNKRLRSSVLIGDGATSLLIDTSPDLRVQSLRHDISRVDAVLLTHPHADHLHGIDDVKGFNFHSGKAIPCYGASETLHLVRERFPYVIAEVSGVGVVRFGNRPALLPKIIEPYQSVEIGGLSILPLLQLHGKMPTLGVRVGNIAYSTDVNNLPEKTLQALESLDVWVVDCLQREPAHTHAHLAMTLEWIERLKPKLAILTHMSHVFDYQSLKRELPPHVVPAYDGLIATSFGTSGVFRY